MKPLETDERINASSVSVRNYAIVFVEVMILCGLYGLLIGKCLMNDLPLRSIVLFTFAFLLFISAVITGIFALLRKNYLLGPVRRLSESARRVAAGDFSVRIPPQRQDGKIDEFEALYQDFNTMAEELGSTEMLKNDFVSNVSHELKTPISVIQNYATMLHDPGITEAERTEYTDAIRDASMRLSVLVSNILMLSRLENQKVPVRTKHYNLSEQLSRCALGFEAVWDERDIELDADLDLDIIIDNDESLLDIVWNNLLSNALKFTEPGGTVKLSAVRDGELALVRVKDTGCGMDEATTHHIFDKFYQGDTSHATAGNGLGLAMVKQILEMTGGEIQVCSAPGAGTTFTVSLPIADAN